MMAGDPNAKLGRLLGPTGPELTCDECFRELDRYVELRLVDADAAARERRMSAHLEGCPACAEEFESLRDLVESGPEAEH